MPSSRSLLPGLSLFRRRTTETVPEVVYRLPRRPGFQTIRSVTDRVAQRYGTANEPPPHLGVAQSIPLPAVTESRDTSGPKTKVAVARSNRTGTTDQKKATPQSSEPEVKSEVTTAKMGPSTSAADSSSTATPQRLGSNYSGTLADVPPTATGTTEVLPSTVNQQPTSSNIHPEEEKPPHLEAPRYVHHFDTYTLVRDLQDDKAFTYDQSVTIMKAVRDLLTDNMSLARDGLVSRGDAEMDSYQFRALAGELRTEVRKRRAAADERMRADRLQLQHEVDTLGQRITQESLTLKDELKGMFDDRKMAVQLERRNVDNRIQELGYKITVAMNSGMRNEIEGLRFTLTRRTVLALAGVVVMVLTMLRLASHQREVNKRREAAGVNAGSDRGIAETHNAGAKDSPSNISSAGEEVAHRLQEGENPALVSLG